MAFFKRKKEDEVLPEEVQDYYNSEQRDRTGMAWLLAAGAFVLTVAVILGVFFAGRWAYRSIFTDNEVTTTENETNEDGDAPNFADNQEPEVLPDSDTDENGNNDNGSADDTDEGSDNATDSDDGDSPSPFTGGSADREQDTTPTTGPSDELPRTGPSGS